MAKEGEVQLLIVNVEKSWQFEVLRETVNTVREELSYVRLVQILQKHRMSKESWDIQK